ncbi:MAG TPA: GNAT family N-acetyltransferase [Flavobacteriales bacterium]|nr:GNAT family N-acetyltransferase [Flavobacteriales bacterium]
MHSANILVLRPTTAADLPTLAEFNADAEACHMAAFTAPDPSDRQAYIQKWTRLLADPSIIARAVLHDRRIVGTVGSWVMEGERQVTYWMDRSVWGRGFATQALQLLLAELSERPLHARVVADNVASKRVLEKCGFTVTGTEHGFAHARKSEVDELVFVLR